MQKNRSSFPKLEVDRVSLDEVDERYSAIAESAPSPQSKLLLEKTLFV
jgi:hypothetical protein